MSSHATNQIERNTADCNIIKTEKKDNDNEDSVFTDARILFESGEKDYYKPIRNGNVFSNNCVEYESNADKEKMLLTEKYLDKMRPYLRSIMNDHETQKEWKIQLKI